MLKMDQISKVYATDTVRTRALESLSVEVDEGEFVAIVGPSGCGKSTILAMTAGLYQPTDGDVFVSDHWTVDSRNPRANDRRR